MKKLIFLLFVILFTVNLFAQFTDFHPELEWYTIKGKHVEVHFHKGAERTAEVVAKIADEVWGPITSLYQYEPDVVHFVIKDIDDYSNGATYFFDNKIEIWTSALDFDLRGTHNWLRNVISHEFTHMVQIQSSMKATRTVPAVFLQWIDYDDERRPDILYGYPNVVASYPLATINVPAWFAEGTAQYMRKEFNYDNWDTHRDMVLRSYALDSSMLTWEQMGVFGKTSLGNESVYNSGFALTKYISQKYGENKLRKIAHALGNLGIFTIDAAFEKVLGKSGDEIYWEWRNFVTNDYKERSKDVLANLVIGDTVAAVGFGNFYPRFSPDSSKILYISNKSADYFSLSSIYEYDTNTKKDKLVVPAIRSAFDWIPGTNKIIYSRLTEKNPNWYNVHDIFVYDFDKKEEKRLTHNLRANQPSISKDGKKIVFIYQKDGTTNLGVVDIDGENFKSLTSYSNGEQVYNPKFSNDDSFIVFDYSYRENRHIAKINIEGGEPEFLVKTKHDDRNPVFDKNGNLIYASDKTGIFNLYSYNLKTGKQKQLTNVIGGAFMPDVNDNGDIVYTGYTSTGFKIFRLNNNEQSEVSKENSYVWRDDPPIGKDKPNGDINNYNLEALQNYDDYNVTGYKKEDYSGAFSSLTVFPYIRIDNYNLANNFFERIKPGLFVTSSDMLNRFSFFAGADINTRLERDLFFVFSYKSKLPLLNLIGLRPELSIELYNISRKADVNVFFGADTVNGNVNYDITIPTDVTYNLFEFDFVAKHRIINRFQNLEFRFIFSRYSAAIGSFIIPTSSSPILYPTTSDTYFIGRDLRLKYSWKSITPTRDRDINPTGFAFDFIYDYEFNKFNESGDYVVEEGLLKPKFENFNFHRLELNTRFYIPLWYDHTLTVQFRGGTILGPEVPSFFNFYLGGLIGMKAYTFYAVEGNELAWLHLVYRFPLARNIDTRLGHLYLDKIFLSFNFDIGDAWTGDAWKFENMKKGAGAEIRLHMNSYYLFPTDLFFNASYGFDKFKRIVNHQTITYGKEWRFYGGILFGFDIVNSGNNLKL